MAQSAEESTAIEAARAAVAAIRQAIEAYEKAGFGSHVIQPMGSALAQADYSLYEVLGYAPRHAQA